MKRILKHKFIIVGVLWLCLCYVVGQTINGDKEEKLNSVELPEAEITHAKISEYDKDGNRIGSGSGEDSNSNSSAMKFGDYSISFEGVNETTDNPWGFTAGLIDVDEIGTCVFLTPNTALVFKNVDGVDSVSFNAKLHPSVAAASDGTGIVFQWLDGEGTVIKEENYSAVVDSEKQKITVENTEQAKEIKILCNNGNQDNDNGDWLIIWE